MIPKKKNITIIKDDEKLTCQRKFSLKFATRTRVTILCLSY